MITSDQAFYLSLFLVKALEIASLTLFAIAIVLGFKNLFETEEFSLSQSVRESETALLAFMFFFFLSGESISLEQGLSATLLGLLFGIGLSSFVKLQPKWLTKGSLIFMVMWSAIVLLSKISERVMSDFDVWWLLLGLFSISMLGGHMINIALRQKYSHRQKSKS